MQTITRKLFFVLILMISISMNAQDVQNGDPVVSKATKENDKETSIIDDKEVEDVFMKVKRVENILKPKKKLRKKKYTIA